MYYSFSATINTFCRSCAKQGQWPWGGSAHLKIFTNTEDDPIFNMHKLSRTILHLHLYLLKTHGAHRNCCAGFCS